MVARGGRDTPDWGGVYNDGQFYPLFDMGELAARLGAMMTYDRRGSVIWQYDFHEGKGDTGAATTGVGSAVNISTSIWERPPASCVLQSGTSDGASASINRRVPIPQSKRVGGAASLRFGPNVSDMYLNLYHYDGSIRWYSYLRFDIDSLRLYTYDNDAGEVLLNPALPDLTTGYYFVHAKIVADLSTHSLVRAIVDDQEYDLSAYTMGQAASAFAPHLILYLNNVGHNLVAATVNVDTMVITAAEP